MRRIGTVLCAVAIVAVMGTSAFAGGFKLSISIGRPVVYQRPVVVYQQPVYQQPVVYQQPIVYQPAPVVYQPVAMTRPPVVMYPPRPQIVQQPIVVTPQPVCIQQPVYAPVYAQPSSGIRLSVGSSSTFRSGHYVYESVRRSNGTTWYRRTWRND